MIGVYEVYNSKTGKRYIGKVNNIATKGETISRIKTQLKTGKHTCKKLQTAWRATKDKTVFSINIIEENETNLEAYERAQYWLDYYDCCTKGYNDYPQIFDKKYSSNFRTYKENQEDVEYQKYKKRFYKVYNPDLIHIANTNFVDRIEEKDMSLNTLKTLVRGIEFYFENGFDKYHPLTVTHRNTGFCFGLYLPMIDFSQLIWYHGDLKLHTEGKGEDNKCYFRNLTKKQAIQELEAFLSRKNKHKGD